MKSVVARRYSVKGLVQGVGFRFFVQSKADSLGLAGYVRNLMDGSVEVLAEGPEQAVIALEEFLHTGPRMARVDSVSVSDVTPSGRFRQFRVTF